MTPPINNKARLINSQDRNTRRSNRDQKPKDNAPTVKAYTTEQQKIGDVYNHVLIITDSFDKALLIRKVTNSPRLDGWYQCEVINQDRSICPRYPIINNLN